MDGLARLRRRPAVAWTLGLAVTGAAAVAVVVAVDVGALRRATRAALADPVALLVVVVVYGLAFLLRAEAWRRVVPGLGRGQALAAIHVALAGNHLLPLRLGEGLRVLSAVRRTPVGAPAATASTVVLRAGDVAALAALVLVTGGAGLLGGVGPTVGLLAMAGLVLGIGLWWSRRLTGPSPVRMPGLTVIAATTLAWVLEAVVIWQAARWAGIALDPREAVLVTGVTVAGQILAVAPAGFGTYELAGTAALAALGVDASTGLAIALTAHAVKTGYALVAGAAGALWPSPGLLGRLRMPVSRAPAPAPAGAEGGIVLFLPAHDEAGRVGEVVRRMPDRACGRPVHCLVVDDGSTDGTAEEAAAAGAAVLRQPTNRGLGAAVRRGFAYAVDRGAAVVAFCDADGEYAPEELERLVAPILDGAADYVVGSRFRGDIGRMLPHRRLGNRTLTLVLRWITRMPISDGQSGYRALSRQAAAAAEIVHDFNYAQVLTIDLLLKGFRYAEVPISYRFRESGRSFVRLGEYLAAVIPAVWRVLNRSGEEPV